jgi:F-type H+-transporting ATPase subunit alpha
VNTPLPPNADHAESGTIVQIGGGMALLSGLANCMAGEVLRFSSGTLGLALALEEAGVRCALLGSADGLKMGGPVWCTGQLPHVPSGLGLLGRVIGPLGQPLDGLGPVAAEWSWPIDHPPAGLAERQPVDGRLFTGLKAVDSLVFIRRGSCPLILGPRRTGKTSIAIDVILNQRDERMPCVYVSIGQPEEAVARVVEDLRRHDALAHTVVVVARASDPVALRFLAPHAGCAVAEAFTYGQGRDTLCVYDDLTRHAAAWQELSLLLGRPPGPGGLPVDLHYQQARLLERAVRRASRWAVVPEDAGVGAVYVGPLEKERALHHDLPNYPGCRLAQVAGSGGSLTALAIVETEGDDTPGPVAASAILLADRRIPLRANLFQSGAYPAVDVFECGGAPGWMSYRLMKSLLFWQEVERFASTGAELDRASQADLRRGQLLRELLKQPRLRPLSLADQAVVLSAALDGFMDQLSLDRVAEWEEQFLRFVREHRPQLRATFQTAPRMWREDAQRLAEAVECFRWGREAPQTGC